MTNESGLKSVARRRAVHHRRWAGLVAAALLAFGLCAGLGPTPAAAQTPPTLAALHIALWPEFDRAGVLVIIDGTLAAGTPLPAQVALRMPAAAGQPNATAYHAADGSLLAAEYTTAAADSAIIVMFSVESLEFRLEYYDPALAVSGNRRTYVFNWTSLYAVTAAVVRVQQPAGATEFATLPALAAAGTGEYGLEYYQGDLGALAAGQAVQVTASYTKPDATLSSATVVAAAPAATSTPTPAASGPSPTLMVLAVAGLALVVGGGAGVLIMRGQRQAAKSRRAPRRHRGSPAARRETAAPAPAPRPARLPTPGAAAPAFCTQCGQRRQPGDQFCRQCGAPVTP